MNKTQLFLLSAIFLILVSVGLVSQFGKSNEKPEKTAVKKSLKTGPKEGLVETYRSDGTLHTAVNYKSGIKEGFSFLYHPDGKTVLLKMPFDSGKRVGTSYKYFEDGSIYAETNYLADKIHGIRKVYNREGRLLSEFTYGYGLIGIGTKEFLKNGSLKKTPEITLSKDLFSANCQKAKFYIGKLLEDQFFDPLSSDLKLLPSSGNDFYITPQIKENGEAKKLDIICLCKSAKGNEIVLRKPLASF